MTLSRDAADQERLIERVRQALALIDAGQVVDPVALCHDCPQLARPLAEVLGLSAELPQLQQAALREDPLAGLVLAGRYALQQCLGRGAMGVVYEARDRELGRDVAVKILDARLFRDPEAERRFQREAEALAALQHPHVVAVFDRGRTEAGIHYLVMERLVGGTLAALLERIAEQGLTAALDGWFGAGVGERVWPRLVASWGAAVADALAAAHAGQLVHRDVKPSNVFVTGQGRVVLLDFGIAARGADPRLTATQTTLGTPWYMPPEQVRAGGAATAQPTVDVYGLGATLFHLLAGRPPYEGDAPTVLAALAQQDPPSLAALRPALPRDLAAIVDTCLDRDPARRYPDAARLAADLRAFLQHQPVTARPLSAWGRRWRQLRRSPAKAIASLAVLLAVVVGGVAVPALRQQEAAQRQREKAALMVTLPSVLAVEGWPEERVLQELRAEHRIGLDLLDRLLALDPDDLALRLFRACLRFDLGERGDAVADIATIAASRQGQYLPQLAQRYAAAGDAAGARSIALDGLPEPVTPEECYVAGFHELRASHRGGFAARADAWFERAAPHYLPARDQRLLSLAALAERAPDPSEKARLCKQLYDETVALETLYGGPTARTCALRGVALLLRREYRAAIPEFERSLQLRAERHGPHQNLGLCWLRLFDLDRADQHLATALRLRPFAWNTRHTMAQAATLREDFATARTLAQGLSKTGARGEAWKQPDLCGSIELAAALALRRTDPAAARAAAAAAVAAYDEALAVRGTPEAQQRRALAVALLDAAAPAVFCRFAAAMLDDPDHPNQLANLAFLLPAAGLDAAETLWLAAILRQLALQRATDDALRTRLTRELAETKARLQLR